MAHYSSWNHIERCDAKEGTSRLHPPTRHTTSMESTTNRAISDYVAKFPNSLKLLRQRREENSYRRSIDSTNVDTRRHLVNVRQQYTAHTASAQMET
ncbi:unnamed protein product [Haemonchus placei]|uniref:DUF4817 domain-containing protein n=1 Tax=Haemonchus placei TaxID=6290 RepID=A0A0N4WA54_HAEPC|nr:unnamed protein product [Haemonchus placei]